MRLYVHEDKTLLGKAAALEGAEAIRRAIDAKGGTTIVLATGVSQFEMLDTLVREDIDWSKVTAFHLDEYVGVGIDHPASFRRYLEERFVQHVGGLAEFVAIDGRASDLDAELSRLNGRIAERTVDVCFAGIGENCHLAFNDPPADFDVDEPYILVQLDEACRRQQMGEGWFETVADVPAQAMSMSIRGMMRSEKLIISVADERKAKAVADALEGPVTNVHPASIMRQHGDCSLHLDPAAAGKLSAETLR